MEKSIETNRFNHYHLSFYFSALPHNTKLGVYIHNKKLPKVFGLYYKLYHIYKVVKQNKPFKSNKTMKT